MKYIIIIFIAVLINISYGQNVPQKLFSSSENGVTVSGKIIELNNKNLTLEFTLENGTSNNLYFTDSPRQISGEQGFYINLADSDSSLLKISSQVHPFSVFYSPYTRYTMVKLEKLEAGEKFSKKIVLKFPLKETIPPNDDPFKLKKISLKKIDKIELSMGYFFEDQGILDFLKTKTQGWYINGEEFIYSGKNKGKTFLDVQNLSKLTISIRKKK